jgi:hypothetical protein
MLNRKKWLWALPILAILGIGIYYLPPVHSRLSWRVDDVRRRITYLINPPDQALFQPTQQVDFESVLATTRALYMLTLTPQATSTPRPGPTLTPTITSTPLPATVNLPGVTYVDQHGRWNYCGPANVTMALNF